MTVERGGGKSPAPQAGRGAHAWRQRPGTTEILPRRMAAMDYTYEGRLERVDGDWLVTFPQFEGCFGGGRTVRKACERAAEALRLAIAQVLSEGGTLPRPSFGTSPQAVFTVQVDERYIEETECVTMARAAEELGVSRGRVSQLVKAGLLDTRNVGGRSMVTLASVAARKSDPPAPHRPRGAE